jgi:hypothetical protein
MKNTIKQILKEELSRADKAEIKKLAKAEFESLIKSGDFKTKIEDMVAKTLKSDKKSEKEVAKITQKVLVKLFKTFWTRRSFWSNNLDNI